MSASHTTESIPFHRVTQTPIPLPSYSTPFSAAASQIRRIPIPLSARLRSIALDAAFVSDVAAAWQPLPVVANERCGSWYVDPEIKKGSAYFKSTDGHVGQWTFSLRRLNLDLLRIVGERSGCIIVDSTRRGKLMPDALSKTIPIWCAVFNALLFPSATPKLETSRAAVPPSEHDQISERLQDFIHHAKELRLDLDHLRTLILKPLRPIWITPGTKLTVGRSSGSYLPVVLVSASRYVPGSEDDYIQGAGDDAESWAQGLTPQLFWQYRSLLFSSTSSELLSVITSLASLPTALSSLTVPVAIAPTPISICPLSSLLNLPYTYTLIISIGTQPSSVPSPAPTQRTISLHIPSGKSGSRALRAQLLPLFAQIETLQLKADDTVLVACESGQDQSVGVALALSCRFLNEQGQWIDRSQIGGNEAAVGVRDKMGIRRRLGWIMAAAPEARPSRATLLAVNDVLMGHKK